MFNAVEYNMIYMCSHMCTYIEAEPRWTKDEVIKEQKGFRAASGFVVPVIDWPTSALQATAALAGAAGELGPGTP
jgi:hypothetical protein